MGGGMQFGTSIRLSVRQSFRPSVSLAGTDQFTGRQPAMPRRRRSIKSDKMRFYRPSTGCVSLISDLTAITPAFTSS